MIPPSIFRQLLTVLPESLQHRLRAFRANNRFGTFIVVGVMNTIVGYLLFLGALTLGLHYTLASLLATILGILFNFTSSGYIVFGSTCKKRLPHYFAGYGIVYAANCIGLFLLGFISIKPSIAAAFLLIPMAGLSYLIQRGFVFRAKH